MKKVFLTSVLNWLVIVAFSQTVSQKLARAYQEFEYDAQLRHAVSSLYVIDAATGRVIFRKNENLGLAPASTQKVVTAVTAFELLGKDFQYKTELVHAGDITGSVLQGNLFLRGSGDPSFGSWRYQATREENIFSEFDRALGREGITKINGTVNIAANRWGTQLIPDGWIWQDIGNYYGAGAGPVNWRENQFDIVLVSGKKLNDPVKVNETRSAPGGTRFISELRSAPKKSGDNAYAYLPVSAGTSYLRGTIPVEEDKFEIAAAMTSPSREFLHAFTRYLAGKGRVEKYNADSLNAEPDEISPQPELSNNARVIYTHYSPSLDSIIYWFLKKSINLYGEALLKTMAFEKKGYGATDTGVAVIRDFWKQKRLDPDELNLYDGSGLSPLNRVTTHAQVEVLKYARLQRWFRYFYDALPEYNGMKLKSGSISDVRAFCGYHRSRDGKNYIIAFIVNNYGGSSTALVNKMYRVLDVLK